MQKAPFELGIKNRVIVSMTTLPERIHSVIYVINTVINQTIKVDKIILCLSLEKFPEKEASLPSELLELRKQGLEIFWCKDIGPHTKYFYTMKKYHRDIVITIDDDIYYPLNLVETLLKSYVKYPYAISARRAHLIEFDGNGCIKPYSTWKMNYFLYTKPTLALLATGVGGVLYPPFSMSTELFNEKVIRKTCLKADDLWLKVVQVLTSTPVVVCDYCKLDCVENTQDVGLWNSNVSQNKNDEQLQAILELYDDGLSNIIIDRIYESHKFLVNDMDACFSKSDNIMRRAYEQQIDELTDRLRKKSISYKLKKIFKKY